MNKLVCELCGSNDVVKIGDFFVCQSCGTKYTPEAAKKMMIEGTVRIDNSASIENYYKMAENAYSSNNLTETETYCNKIIEIDPNHYKAWFLKGKAAGWQSTLANLRIEEAVNCFFNAVDFAPEHERFIYEKNAAKETENLSSSLLKMCCNNFAEYPSTDNCNRILNSLSMTNIYSLKLLLKCGVSANSFKNDIANYIVIAANEAYNNVITKDYQHREHPGKFLWEQFVERTNNVITLQQTAIDLCDDDDQEDIIRYKNLIYLQTEIINSCSYKYDNGGWSREWSLTEDAQNKRIDKIMEWHNKIQGIDSTYEIPNRPKVNRGGCYIATCIYGSYDCPQVWTLRRYRDYTLAETWYGRAFIQIYYAVSPTIVKWFGKTNWFKKIWKQTLDRMVNKLNSEGVQNTPYTDKKW